MKKEMHTFQYLEGLREGRKGNSYWLAIKYRKYKVFPELMGEFTWLEYKSGFLDGYKIYKALRK
jgi:hypothetical protein